MQHFKGEEDYLKEWSERLKCGAALSLTRIKGQKT